MTRRMCQEEVENLILHVDGRSVAGAVVDTLVDISWKECCRRKVWNMLEADADLQLWTKKQIELKEEEDARSQKETAREERFLRKAMLEVEWSQRRAVVVENMEIADDSMVDILAEQVRLMDIWINDMEISAKELREEKIFVAD